MAARIMRQSEANQILFTEEAYQIVIDMVDNPNFDEKFLEYTNVKIKHGLRINVYQYIGEEAGINTSPAENLLLAEKAQGIMKKFSTLGMPSESMQSQDFDKKKLVDVLETMSQLFTPQSQAIDIIPSAKKEENVPNK